MSLFKKMSILRGIGCFGFIEALVACDDESTVAYVLRSENLRGMNPGNSLCTMYT